MRLTVNNFTHSSLSTSHLILDILAILNIPDIMGQRISTCNPYEPSENMTNSTHFQSIACSGDDIWGHIFIITITNLLCILSICGRQLLHVCCTQGISAERKQTVYSRKMKEADCEKLDCHNARFGFALANAQDVDGDGYQGAYDLFMSGL